MSDLMAAGARWAREHGVEKVSVFAVHIFSRATPVREQSRTNGRDSGVPERCSFRQLEQTNTLE